MQVRAAENPRPFPGTPDPQSEVGEAERQQPKKWGTEERGRSWGGRWLGWSRRQEPERQRAAPWATHFVGGQLREAGRR